MSIVGYDALYDWSVAHIPEFWEAVWKFVGVTHSEPYSSVLEDPTMPGAKWFQGARLNFAENLLRYRDDRPALVSVREGGDVAARLTYAELYDQVARVAAFLRQAGVTAGDRVAGYLPNCHETVVAMLAATSLGAVWSSCSPDFGFRSVLERFGQIEPKVLFAADGYRYHGRNYETLSRVTEVARGIESLTHVVIVPFLEDDPDISQVPGALPWATVLDNPADSIEFAQLPFDHPHVHHVLVGHYRRSKVHCPRRRRHAHPARQGTHPADRRGP